MMDDIVADASSMADRMGRRDWEIEIIFQLIKYRRGQVQMHCLGDWRGYHDLLANASWTQPNRTSFRDRLLIHSCLSSPYETVLIAGNNQANLHMLRNNLRSLSDPMRSEFHG